MKCNLDHGLLCMAVPSPIQKVGLQIGERLIIAIDLDQSNYPANQQQVLGISVSFTSGSKMYKNVRPKPFCLAK
jgi:hypothetical protein